MHQVMNSGRRLSAAAALVFAAILAISLFGLAGCSAAEPKDDTSAASTSDESVPEHAATEEGDEPIEGASMNSVFEVGTDDAAKSVEAVGDKSPNAGLSWSGVMGVSIEDACLYQSFAAAQEANAGLELEKDADESGAVLVCKVLVENDSAVDASGSDLFKADFLYLNSDRIPVTSCVPQDGTSSDGSLLDFKLSQGETATLTVGFAVPETWWTDKTAYEGRENGGTIADVAYLAFGSGGGYRDSPEGVVPVDPFAWLSIHRSDEEVPSGASATFQGQNSGVSMGDYVEIGTRATTETSYGWTGSMDAWVMGATLYRNADEAAKHVSNFEVVGDAEKDDPVLVCEVTLKNHDAKPDDSHMDLFKADFMYVGPERIPVGFIVPQSDDDTEKDALSFSFDDKEMADLTVGFSVPKSWLDAKDREGKNYLAYGRVEGDYHKDTEGLVVPTVRYTWLDIAVA
ncbi:hypothetical protein [Adlercreutzia caecimuris]|uniref:hypothetical protein n=1 Tax=Adlercreutzia caecimuris TaxID=671266 RepID=UPI001C3C5782|nr:hypothetical protein [Adlercreutzia caecimuris]MCR2037685.1 hypothetical protein [Adlercreutzia caecimuris]